MLCYVMSGLFLLSWIHESKFDWNIPRNVLNDKSDTEVLFWSDSLKEFWSIILQQLYNIVFSLPLTKVFLKTGNINFWCSEIPASHKSDLMKFCFWSVNLMSIVEEDNSLKQATFEIKCYNLINHSTEIRCVRNVQIRSFFWSVFSRIRTEYGKIWSISPYSVRMQENTDQKNSVFGHISRRGYLIYSSLASYQILQLA